MCKKLSLVTLALLCTIGLGAQAPDRSRPPALGPAPALKLPPIEKRTLSNGLPVWVVAVHEVPLVQVNLLVDAGAGADPAAKLGLSSLTAAMLDEGAGSRSSLQIADAIDFLGATLATTSTFDAAAIRLNVPVARVAAALPIMADVALRPTFPRPDLERVRQERLTMLLQARDDPAQIIGEAFVRQVYGPAHRYGALTMGSSASIKALGVGDLRAFHQTEYRPDNATLVVVGDTTVDAVRPLLESAFGAWRAPGVHAPPPVVPAAPQLKSRRVVIVDKPGAEQSQIRIGWVGVPRSTPDYFPLQVLNTILGGSFSSRLNQNLREKHGYTYGAGSGFDMRLGAGPFYATAGVQTDKTADALREFFIELDAIHKPVPPDELSRAKNFVALGFPAGFETSGDLSRKLEELIVYHLPDDYFSNYVAHIQAVTSADVQQVAARYIQPNRFVVVIVGDAKKIEAGVRALKLGPTEVLSVDQALGPQ